MKYYILKQDRNLENAIKLVDFNNSQKMMLLKDNENDFKDITNMPVSGKEFSVYPEFLQAPVLLVSDELHEIFKWYENTIIYKTVVFTNMQLKTQKIYKLVLSDLLDVLSDKTTYLKNGDIDKIVLDSNKIGVYNIFSIKAGLGDYFIVSLDVVESILKRASTGIKFEEVEVI
ncbi:hypothetical protein [Clostridium estertheticum]|uniref:hypothetical protein n=1 Tax=Clostridium estertheticum TaxID=238834 RepID=UPI001C0E0FC4|nr:hypothetical protein [Clostridium estertheticum]MBU3215194.1 hypothetical protein [Clostridium estertheticum]MBX4262432.1 hypothetical protein [Clostridium estertheticum]MCB2355770.1 hypothetical protein [Clostridium estertheticum]WAG39356.1 hypothetical protein LL065_13705 [Clostridium estertheticum]WAG55519.1 hypothetical protein LL033_23535 [Clostridium estertheticum]